MSGPDVLASEHAASRADVRRPTLLANEAETLSLDHVAEALGALHMTSDEIEALFDWLEARGRPMMAPVRSSRKLHAATGRSPRALPCHSKQ